ncbi:hypothetical protein QBC43DRAFT_9817 [Cladorrhinum sp. PSN259]|nr:hypothetical protein QBC43DRAFT_9817 [Cladorrhinum sp. PSN259]
MLLRNVSSSTPATGGDSHHQQDQDIFFTMSSHDNNSRSHFESENSNTMDDIWGSDPEDSATAYHQHNHHYHHTATTTTTTNHHHHYHHSHSHISDIPRLQQEHTNAGYRDGITFAKSQHVQSGFDEGYSLGATIGARAGQLLGLLEGLAAAIGLHFLSSPPPLSSSSTAAHKTQEDSVTRMESLLKEARKELSVQSIFSKEYWGEDDGVWKYEVDGTENGDEEMVFGDVAGAHPLIKKWDGIVRAEAAGYGVDWDVLRDGERDFLGDEDTERGNVKREVQRKGMGREALAW